MTTTLSYKSMDDLQHAVDHIASKIKPNTERLCKDLLSSANNIWSKGDNYYKNGDEENAFIFFMRYLLIITTVQSSYEFKKAKERLKTLMNKKHIDMAVLLSEKLKRNLQQRYEQAKKKLQEKKDIENQLMLEKKNSLKRKASNKSLLDEEIDHLILPEVPTADFKRTLPEIPTDDKAENKNSVETIPENTKANGNISNINGHGVSEKHSVKYPSYVCMAIMDFYAFYKSKKENIDSMLIIDTRPAEEFYAAHINFTSLLNIPKDLLTPGANINTIDLRLSKNDWSKWESRHNRRNVVIFDDEFTENNNNSGNTPAEVLLNNILLKQAGDFHIIIVYGGFHQWLFHFPSFTTNPTYSKKPKTVVLNPMDELKNIEYPSLPNRNKTIFESSIPKPLIGAEDLNGPIYPSIDNILNPISKETIDKPNSTNMFVDSNLKINDNEKAPLNSAPENSAENNDLDKRLASLKNPTAKEIVSPKPSNINSDVDEKFDRLKYPSMENANSGTNIKPNSENYDTRIPKTSLKKDDSFNQSKIDRNIKDKVNPSDVSTNQQPDNKLNQSLKPVLPVSPNIASNFPPSASNITPATNNISSNAINILPSTNNIAPNETNIAPNATNIAPNATNIAPNATNIAPNATNIAPMTNNIGPITNNIGPITNNIAPNTTNIAPITNNIAPNATNIAPITNNIAPNAKNVTPGTTGSIPIARNNKPVSSIEMPKDTTSNMPPDNARKKEHYDIPTPFTNNTPTVAPTVPPNDLTNRNEMGLLRNKGEMHKNPSGNVAGNNVGNVPHHIIESNNLKPKPHNVPSISQPNSNMKPKANNTAAITPVTPVPNNSSLTQPQVPIVSKEKHPPTPSTTATQAKGIMKPAQPLKNNQPSQNNIQVPSTPSSTKAKAAPQTQPTRRSRKYITTFGLPEGWEKAVSHDNGRIYYIDHNTQTTHWNLPSHIKDKVMNQLDDSIEKPVETPSQSSKRVTFKEERPSLKRSLSSPNIKELIDSEKEIKKEKPSIPVIDRSVKPKEEKRQIVDRSKKPISASRLNNLSPIYGSVGRCLTGLKNLGNTCYMNSVLQCLSNTIPLAQYLHTGTYERNLNLKNMNPRPGEIAREMAFVFKVLYSGQYKSVSPVDFKRALGRFSAQFSGYEQQDSHELLMFLLDGLHEDVNKVKSHQVLKERDTDKLTDVVAADLAWQDYHLNNDSPIVDLFQGQFRSTVVCLSCHKQSKTFDAFNCLQLGLPNNQSASLEQCINSFIKSEKIGGNDSWRCSNCKRYREASKTIEIWKLPPVLIVQLKRFRFDGRWHNKIQTAVNFPTDNLNLSSFVVAPTSKFNNYRLYGIINHYGSFDSGHYTAYAESAYTNKWHCYDDNVVKEINKNSIKTNAAYLLFYTAVNFNDYVR